MPDSFYIIAYHHLIQLSKDMDLLIIDIPCSCRIHALERLNVQQSAKQTDDQHNVHNVRSEIGNTISLSQSIRNYV